MAHLAQRTAPSVQLGSMMLQGGALEAQGRLAAAAALYETTAQSFPECAEPIEAYANALARMGQSERALAQFQCALQRRPDSANAHFRIGEILAQLGRYRESVPHFERAVALKPDWLEARELSGRMLWICHEYGAAAKVWREWRAAQAEAARSQGLDPQQFRILDPVWTRWLGNHAHLDAYVKIGLLGWRKPVPIKLLAPRGKVANEAYLALWRDYVEVVSAPEEIERLSALTGVLGDSLHTMLVDEVPTYYTNAIAVVQAEWERQGRAPLLQLSEEERERGWQMLASLGIPRTAWFACLHVREPGFWNEADDRTNRPRVASIRSYLPAIEHIVSRGGWVVRLGDSSMQALAPMPGLIDYARSDAKSDWMDVFLCASCRFLIGTNSALYQVCITFGTPSVATNWVPLSSFPMSGRDIVLPKRLRSRADGTELPFDAVLRLPRDAPFGQLFDHHRLDLIDNTPEEILEGVEEMLQRSDGVWESSDEARARVERFSEIAALHRVTVNGSIGERFLARHAGLLA